MIRQEAPRPGFADLLGLGRSLLMYYAIPGRTRAWRRFYRAFIQPGDLCFDAGAHVGSRSRALLACGARVLALEPQPLFYATLQRLLGSKPDLVLDPRGLSDQAGEATLRASRRTPTVSTLSGEWAEEVGQTTGFHSVRWDAEARVPVTTLDALIAEHGLPVFCKLDIEGSEAIALQGLSQPIRHVSFEYLPAAMKIAQECIQRLESLAGYEYNLVRSEYPRFHSDRWLSAAEVRDSLAAIDPAARAGEVYARQVGV